MAKHSSAKQVHSNLDVLELEKETEKFRRIVESAPNAIVLVNHEGKITLVNAQTEKLFDYLREELIGQPIEMLVPERFRGKHPGYRDNFFTKPSARALGAGRDLYGVRKDGREMPIDIGLNPLQTEEGLLALASIIDITERKKAEEELNRFFTLSLDMLCIAGFDGYFKRLNPLWETTLGYTINELLAVPYLDFVHPDDRESTLAEAKKLTEGVNVVSFENRYRCKDGTYKHLLWSSTMSLENSLVYASARDITERKRAEEALHAVNTQLEVANKELEAFSYSASHDLRAPLRHINGFVELMQKHASATLDEKSRRYLNVIAESASRMGQLIDDLLAFSHVGRTEMRKTTVDLQQLVREAMHNLNQEAQGRNIEWKIEAFPEVEADPTLLKLVLQNLIGNALKYTRTRETATIEIGSMANETETVFFIRDNGVGFDMQYVDKLFGVFQRLHRVDEFEGTGIGLANVRRIVSRHGGRTWAEGAVDKGATFSFTLPKVASRT